MNEILAKQMAADYCCTIEEVCDGNSHYTVYAPRPDRRRFEENAECLLKVAVINGKLLFTGREDIIEDCRKTYGNASGEWFLHAGIPTIPPTAILYQIKRHIDGEYLIFFSSFPTKAHSLQS